MPTFFSTDFPEFSMPDLKEIIEGPGLDVAGSTLGELLANIEADHAIRIVPDPGEPKYFRYHSPAGSPNFSLVDVHITRDGVDICPKQDLSFPLLASDTVTAGVLVC